MEAALRRLCNQTVTIEPFASYDKNGKPTYGASVSYKAQITGKNRMVRDAQGLQVVASLTVILSQWVNVSTKDKLTLPVTYVPRTPPILAVAKFQDETTTHHTTVYMQ
jgi:hypothetical protein